MDTNWVTLQLNPYVWFNSACYHPPRAYPRGFAIFFLTGQSIPHPQAHSALTHNRETMQLVVYKIRGEGGLQVSSVP